ncbi:MAG: hypothetical protein CSA26_09600 [Desulfobacterales bacterium]|nr:MAG: hypothetical protein CSA26_09600 [Desulfobacterales bacterium]
MKRCQYPFDPVTINPTAKMGHNRFHRLQPILPFQILSAFLTLPSRADKFIFVSAVLIPPHYLCRE